MKPHILIIDDDIDFINDFSLVLDEDYKCSFALNGHDAISLIQDSVPDVILLDLMLGNEDNGLELLNKLQKVEDVPVIMVTDYASVQTAVEALKLGASDYISKTTNLTELKILIEKTINQKILKNHALSLEEQLNKDYKTIIGESEAIKDVYYKIKLYANTDSTILITGESGVGKELVARQVHFFSNRKMFPFVAINCAAIPRELLESELFGHVKGSFTNAISDKKGLFEEANNGTILLDEIGETSETFQTKLLRVLQNGEIQKVGSAAAVKVDVRIIAATNKNLKALVDAKIFREDLYYRLNVIQIKIPPLRERKEDIPAIIEFFLEKEDGNFRVSKAVMDILLSNEWKGNVRELESIIKRAVIYAKSEEREVIQLKDLPDELSKLSKSNMDDVIIEALAAKNFSHSSINETASDLNLSRTLVSENLRGYLFKNLVKTNFDIDLAVVTITKDKDSADKLKSKLQTYLTNIKKDLEKLESKDFDFIKAQFTSKYKNLPQKYHSHLDEIIKYLLNS